MTANTTNIYSTAVENLDLKTEKLSIKQISRAKLDLKWRMDQITAAQDSMQAQGDDLEWLLDMFNQWELEFKNVERFSLGVPQTRFLRENCLKIKTIMAPNGEFDRTVKTLSSEGVMGFELVEECLQRLKEKTSEKTPNAQFAEEVRQLIGEMIATVTTILSMLYE